MPSNPSIQPSTVMESNTRSQFLYLGIFVVLAVTTLCRYYLSSLIYEDVFHFDSHQHIPWAYRIASPELFPNDIVQDYWEMQVGTPGYRFLFWLTKDFISPLLLCECVQFVLGFCLLIAVYRIATVSFDVTPAGSILSVIIFIYIFGIMYGWNHSCGGFTRSYGYPIVALGILACMSKRYFWVGVSALLGSLFYPPAFLVLALLSAFCLGANLFTNWRWSIRQGALAVILGIPAGVIILTVYGQAAPEFIGPAFDWTSAVAEPELRLGGILPIIRSDSWMTNLLISSPTTTISLAGTGLALALQTCLAAAWRRPTFYPRLEVVALFVAALVLFIAGWIFFVRLYEPSRFVRYTIPFVMWLTVTSWLQFLVDFFRTSNFAKSPSIFQQSERLIIAVSVLFICWTSYRTIVSVKLRADGVVCGAYPSLPDEIYKTLSAQPLDVVVAGHPTECADIPLLTRRSVLVHHICCYPYRQSFFNEMQRRSHDYLALLYSANKEDLVLHSKEQRFDLLLVNRRKFTSPSAWSMPTELLAKKLHAAAEGKFLLANPPSQSIVCEAGDFMLIDFRKLLASAL